MVKRVYPPASMQVPNGTTPETFDVEGFLSGFRPPVVQVQLHHRADLIPRLKALLEEIDELKSAPARETSWAAGDPLEVKVAEFNAAQAEFLAGGSETFEFAPRSKVRVQAAAEAFKASGHPVDDPWWSLMFTMAAHCVTPAGLTGEAFNELQEHMGSDAFGPLTAAFSAAFDGGGEPDVPFSQLPSPNPGTPVSSED